MMVSTFSDHQRTEPERLVELQRELGAAIEEVGGMVHVGGGTYVRLAR